MLPCVHWVWIHSVSSNVIEEGSYKCLHPTVWWFDAGLKVKHTLKARRLCFQKAKWAKTWFFTAVHCLCDWWNPGPRHRSHSHLSRFEFGRQAKLGGLTLLDMNTLIDASIYFQEGLSSDTCCTFVPVANTVDVTGETLVLNENFPGIKQGLSHH